MRTVTLTMKMETICRRARRLWVARAQLNPATVWLAGILALAFLPLPAPGAGPAPMRERLSLNADWRFIKGDSAEAGDALSYQQLKPWLVGATPEFAGDLQPLGRPPGNPGAGLAYTRPDFDDSGWRKLTLPHDWGIEGPFTQEFPGETGKLPWWGVAWYRKHFPVAISDQGRQFYLELDGAMAYAAVWVNGQFVGGWPYGYASWRVDLTAYIRPGADNVLAIRLDNPPDSSRWYPGGGIYRNVWLVKTSPLHVAQWGTYVTTPEVSQTAATVEVKVNIDNRSINDAEVVVLTDIYAIDQRDRKLGRPVASAQPKRLRLAPRSTGAASAQAVVFNPALWCLQQPNRCTVVTTLVQDGNTVDVYETPFGIRTIKFTRDHGFVLNGDRIQLNGVCDHHDLGALGTAINTRALERQIELLQEMGCNAIRTSHNPPAPELLDLCDRMGMVVMDEAFDCWQRGKKRNDYHLLFADWHEKDVRAWVRRDRSHPSVVLWSIGNEIGEQESAGGAEVAAELAALVRSEEPTRPVTAACNRLKAGYNGFQKQLDVFGYNYKPDEYWKFRQANPNQPLLGSETASCVSSRGEYFFPVSTNKADGRADFQVSSYDLYAPRWATLPDVEFKGQDRCPFVAGEFVWTGFDYLGEPTPFNGDASNLLNFTDPADLAQAAKELKELGKIRVPSRSSYFGIIDLAGFKKDRFYSYQARWRSSLKMAHIVPHWTWPERAGKVTPVQVYTSGDSAELFLNGVSLGRKSLAPMQYRLTWNDVVYQPGELKVVAYKNGFVWAQDSVATAGPASKLLLKADRAAIKADGRDLSFVTVTVADRAGEMASRARNKIAFELSGPGEIIATDNGDPTSFEPFQSKQHSAFNGLCLVVIRSTGQPGRMVLSASSPGLKPAQIKLEAKP